MRQIEMMQEMMFEELKRVRAEVTELNRFKAEFVQLQQDFENFKKQRVEIKGENQSIDEVIEVKQFTRSTARDIIIDRIKLNVPGTEVRSGNRIEGSGIVVCFPEVRNCDPYRDYNSILEIEEAYCCKFYYSQSYDTTNPISWTTVNKDALTYDYFIFTLAAAPDPDDTPNPDDVDGPNLQCLIFTKEQLKKLIADAHKVPDKTGKYHFSFTIQFEDGCDKAFEVRDTNVDVTYALDNFTVFKRAELPF